MSNEELRRKMRESAERIHINVTLCKHRDLFDYARSAWRTGSIYEHFLRYFSYLRRFRLAAMLLRAASWITVGIETGAFLLLSTAVLLIFLPPLLFFSIGILLTALIEAPIKSRELSACTAKKRVYILFLPEQITPFFEWNVSDLAAESDNTVLLISPFYLFSRGLQKGDFYCTVRRERENVYLVRKYAFFYFRKRVLQHRSCVYLY